MSPFRVIWPVLNEPIWNDAYANAIHEQLLPPSVVCVFVWAPFFDAATVVVDRFKAPPLWLGGYVALYMICGLEGEGPSRWNGVERIDLPSGMSGRQLAQLQLPLDSRLYYASL